MTCFFCKGEMEASTTSHMTELGESLIIIKKVPCSKCTQCGEVSYNIDVAIKLEDIINKVKSSIYSELTITTYDVA